MPDATQQNPPQKDTLANATEQQVDLATLFDIINRLTVSNFQTVLDEFDWDSIRLKNLKDGVDDQDAVSLLQVNTLIAAATAAGSVTVHTDVGYNGDTDFEFTNSQGASPNLSYTMTAAERALVALLSTAGPATEYLDKTGNYSTPTGASVSTTEDKGYKAVSGTTSVDIPSGTNRIQFRSYGTGTLGDVVLDGVIKLDGDSTVFWGLGFLNNAGTLTPILYDEQVVTILDPGRYEIQLYNHGSGQTQRIIYNSNTDTIQDDTGFGGSSLNYLYKFEEIS